MLSTSVGLAVALSGGAAFSVTLSNRTVTDDETSPANAMAGFRLGTDGKIYVAQQSGNSNYAEVVGAEWLDPKDAAEADNYEAFWTTTSGTLSSGTAGSWVGLETDQTWTRDRNVDTPGTTTCIGTLEIRRKGTSSSLATATITLNGTVS